MTFLAQFGDAGLQAGKIRLRLLENPFELRDFIRLAGELALEVGGQFVGLLHVVLQRLVFRPKRGAERGIGQWCGRL